MSNSISQLARRGSAIIIALGNEASMNFLHNLLRQVPFRNFTSLRVFKQTLAGAVTEILVICDGYPDNAEDVLPIGIIKT
jgi:hypothetical protein